MKRETYKSGFYSAEFIAANAGAIAGIMTMADRLIEKDLYQGRAYGIEDHIVEAFEVIKEFASEEFVEVKAPDPESEEA